MGGNAIKPFVENPVRINTELYKEVSKFVLEHIKNVYPEGTLVKELGTFSDKESFGDIDVLVGVTEIIDDVIDSRILESYLNERFNLGKYAVINNGPTSSFVLTLITDEYEEAQFQVDLNYVPYEVFDCAHYYHGNADLGNLLGRIFAGIGLKYRHTGLYYIHKSETLVVGEILLTNQFSEILNAIGLDIADANFATAEDVYDFVISSPFFHKDLFLFENRNHDARVRDSKRKHYNEFLEYIKDLPSGKMIANQNFAMSLVFHFGKELELLNLMKKEAGRLMFKAVADTKLIQEKTGLDGIELGDLMKTLRSDIFFDGNALLKKGFKVGRDRLMDIICPPF
jgi:hypothetical protein